MDLQGGEAWKFRLNLNASGYGRLNRLEPHFKAFDYSYPSKLCGQLQFLPVEPYVLLKHRDRRRTVDRAVNVVGLTLTLSVCRFTVLKEMAVPFPCC